AGGAGVRVLVGLSGGVDSSVAAALLVDAGHEVVGATMKLWGGPSDSGCCSVADVEDARAVADRLGVAHHVFNFTAEFERDVVSPYVADHGAGRTPNPCVSCNRHLKFDRFLRRADQLGFDAVATGHHARVVAPTEEGGAWSLRRGLDPAKDQSYVLHMLGQAQLARLLLPVGELTKDAVRAAAAEWGLRTAGKPDSQDVCFVTRDAGRAGFLGERLQLRPAAVVDGGGRPVGSVDAVELVTVGQRRGLGLRPGVVPPGERRYAVDVDPAAGVVRLGALTELLTDVIPVAAVTWVGAGPVDGEVLAVQCSAHGAPTPATWVSVGPGRGEVRLARPQRRVAAGQSVVLYRHDEVLGGGIAERPGDAVGGRR
ncbi:MAG TPA: tRNA 2-thiouridine(34) synthase MnmA, partial [Acidimicrobiales bacterium]|nr:tRNA 2-thiouridine(34) synthase MnmA [Acidimicrobiales bacterium]